MNCIMNSAPILGRLSWGMVGKSTIPMQPKLIKLFSSTVFYQTYFSFFNQQLNYNSKVFRPLYSSLFAIQKRNVSDRKIEAYFSHYLSMPQAEQIEEFECILGNLKAKINSLAINIENNSEIKKNRPVLYYIRENLYDIEIGRLIALLGAKRRSLIEDKEMFTFDPARTKRFGDRVSNFNNIIKTLKEKCTLAFKEDDLHDTMDKMLDGDLDRWDSKCDSLQKALREKWRIDSDSLLKALENKLGLDLDKTLYSKFNRTYYFTYRVYSGERINRESCSIEKWQQDAFSYVGSLDALKFHEKEKIPVPSHLKHIYIEEYLKYGDMEWVEVKKNK